MVGIVPATFYRGRDCTSQQGRNYTNRKGELNIIGTFDEYSNSSNQGIYQTSLFSKMSFLKAFR